jgi:uncharacterized damage-inducible protein DinB
VGFTRDIGRLQLAEVSTGALALYPGWDTHEELLIKAISPLTPQQLALRPASHLRSIEENCLHIIGARGRWCHYMMGIGDDTFAAFARWDSPGMPVRRASELVSGLRESWQVLREALTRMTLADLEGIVPNIDRDPGEPEVYSRGWIMWHLIEHDIHHGGEISLILGMNELSGLDV